MDNLLADLLGVAIPAILVGILGLVAMVQFELGPFSRLSPGGKWLLTGGLGMGILAFTFKIAVAAMIAQTPAQALALTASFQPRAEARRLQQEPPSPSLPAASFPHTWQALPETAPAPPDNPTTPEKVALGRRLFFEKRLSADGTLACATCHDLTGKAGADGRPTAAGIGGQRGSRNTPTVWNAAFQSVLFWDGRAHSLEEQAMGPILNPMEMGLDSPATAQTRLARDPAYPADFARAFGDPAITFTRIAQAIAAFERTLVTPDTPYDRFLTGDRQALSQAQLRGMALFESIGCVNCHRGPVFSDAGQPGGRAPWRLFPAHGLPEAGKYQLLADGGAAPKGSKAGVWRVPSLRNVALTAPYFHNGSVDKLADAVRIMARAQLGRSGTSHYWLDGTQALTRIDHSPLKDEEIEDIVAFLKALSSDKLAQAMQIE